MSASSAADGAPAAPAPPLERRGPGRPASDAPSRILEAALEVLNNEGYSGLTTAKVAAESGQNKAMIAYYFDSKAGLIAAAARRSSESFIAEILDDLGTPASYTDLVAGLADGVDAVMTRDPRMARVYFDLVAQSAIEGEAREIIRETGTRYRRALEELILATEDGPEGDEVGPTATFLIASIEGLALERLERGASEELEAARRIFVRAAGSVVSGPRV